MPNKPPFCWCHDDQIPDDAAVSKWISAPCATGLHGRCDDDLQSMGCECPCHNDAQAPQEGVTYVSSWGEILYAMTNGETGTPPPQTPRRYEPKPKQS